MASNEYQFFTHWQVSGRPEEVYDIILDASLLPAWWPSVYLKAQILAPGEPDGVGRRVSLHTKGFLPYTLRWDFEVTEAERPSHLVLEARGDFVGRGVWALSGRAEVVDIRFDWRISAEKPLLRALSGVFKPIFTANHEWAMARGLESLRLELLRRRAKDPVALARIPAPPGPTFPHNLF
jgi:hypothetical protein